MLSKVNKGDAIKQNESELTKMKSQFSISLYMYASTSEQYHTENPVKIKHTVPEI